MLVQLCYVGMAGMGTLWRCSTGIRVSRYYFFLFFSSSSACSCPLFPTSDITWLLSTPRSYPEKCFRITILQWRAVVLVLEEATDADSLFTGA